MPTPKQAAKNRRQQLHATRMRAVFRRDIGLAMAADNRRLAATWKLVHEHRAAHPDDDRDFDTIAAELKPQIAAEMAVIRP